MRLSTLVTPCILLPLAASQFSIYEDIFAFPKYEIKYITDKAFSRTEADQLIHDTSLNATYELLKLPDTDFLCAFPNNEYNHDEQRQRQQLMIDSVNNTESLTQLSSVISEKLEGKCFQYQESFWRYQYCHKNELSQSHKDLKYVLGRYKPESTGLRLTRDSGIYVLSSTLIDGTVCDLTGEKRKTELQYACNPESLDREDQYIMKWVHEYKTCGYVAQIHIPELCQIDLFKQQKYYDHIVCQKVLDYENFDQMLAPHLEKLNIVDYYLEKIGKGLYVGASKIKNDKSLIVIDTQGKKDISQRFANGFYTALKAGKFTNDPIPLFEVEFDFQAHVYDKAGEYLTTLFAEQVRDEKLEIIVRTHESNAVIETNFKLRPVHGKLYDGKIPPFHTDVTDENGPSHDEQQILQQILQLVTEDVQEDELDHQDHQEKHKDDESLNHEVQADRDQQQHQQEQQPLVHEHDEL